MPRSRQYRLLVVVDGLKGLADAYWHGILVRDKADLRRAFYPTAWIHRLKRSRGCGCGPEPDRRDRQTKPPSMLTVQAFVLIAVQWQHH